MWKEQKFVQTSRMGEKADGVKSMPSKHALSQKPATDRLPGIWPVRSYQSDVFRMSPGIEDRLRSATGEISCNSKH